MDLKAATTLGTPNAQQALRLTNGSGITSADTTAMVKAATALHGLDATRYSTHSIRIGRATKLLHARADRLVIKLLGRWLSNCFEDYPVLTAEGTTGLSTLMC